MVAPDHTAISWKRNLATMWLVRFFSGMGISFMYPFMPLFVQDLGIDDPGRAALWAGAAIGVSGIPAFIFGPIWGVLGDRFGRKKNVLRAIFGTASLLLLMGLSTNVYQLIVFRLLYGMVTGVDASSTTLIVATSPKERIPFSIGVLQSSGSAGNTFGPILGALIAETLGFQAAFFTAGGLLAFGGVLVMLLVRDNFQPPPGDTSIIPRGAFRGLWDLMTSRQMLPMLVMLFMLHLVSPMMLIALPILLGQLHAQSVARATGIAFALRGLMAGLASYTSGWLANKVGLVRILVVACMGAGLSYLLLLVMDSFPMIFLTLALVGVFQGALLTAATGLVGITVPSAQLGAAFGGLQSITLSSFTTGPLVAGVVVSTLGVRVVFLVQALLVLTVAVLAVSFLRRRQQPATADTPH